MGATILTGDVLDVLPTIPDASVDAVLCDPPYGLSDHRHVDVMACLTAWLAGQPFRPKKRGFMGRGWDAWVPGPECWHEVLRVLRPGGHALVFAGTRSMDLMGMALRLAGFEIRECIRDINDRKHYPGWLHGGAMPKHRTLLRSAWEPVIVARKRLDGTLEANIARHGTGGLNVDGCRVGLRHPTNVMHDGSDCGHRRHHHQPDAGKRRQQHGTDLPRHAASADRQPGSRRYVLRVGLHRRQGGHAVRPVRNGAVDRDQLSGSGERAL